MRPALEPKPPPEPADWRLLIDGAANGLLRLFGIEPVEELHGIVSTEELDRIAYNLDGLVPAIAQDAESGEIMMLANMNEESFARTLELGEAVYWSRSRKKLWHKGEESGNVQRVKELLIDCDGDAVVMKVEQVGDAACHTGMRSCFFRKIDPQTREVSVQGERVFDPAEVYKKG